MLEETSPETRGGWIMTDVGDEAAVERPDEDDYDLLTFGEAGARLEIEIRAMRSRVAQLEQGSPLDEAALAAARNRLAALQEGAARNAAQPINDENFERFFGYPGKARRNTAW
jgi:L-rhamnose isomerase